MRVPSALVALVIAGLALAAVDPAADAAASDPTSLVTGLGAQLGQVLTDRTLSPVGQKERFRAILDSNFDFPVISRFVLGRYWQGSSDAFHLEFANVFEDYVIQSLSARFANYNCESIRVTASHSESEHSTVVSTTIDYRGNAAKCRLAGPRHAGRLEDRRRQRFWRQHGHDLSRADRCGHRS